MKMTNKWAVIFNKQLELYIAVSSENGLKFLEEGEETCKINLTKAQALQKANEFNRLADWIKENK